MAFSSINLIFIFLPVFLIVYFLIPRVWRNLWIFVGSIGFYAVGSWNEPQYIALLILSVIVNFRYNILSKQTA